MEKIKDGGGKAKLKTVEGAELTFAEKDGKLWVIDAKGDMAQVTIAQRHAVERRHPRDRHRAAAGLIADASPRHRETGAARTARCVSRPANVTSPCLYLAKIAVLRHAGRRPLLTPR